MRWLGLLLLVSLIAGWPHSALSRPLDWSIPGGHFYTQTAGPDVGFLVGDTDGIPFLTEFQARGGPDVLGYPISRRFEWKGTTVQAFQKAVLQWLPAEQQIAFLNIFDDLSRAGQDNWLRQVRSTPGQAWLDDESHLSWDAIVKGRLAFLDANPAIKARYFAVADPMALYGLPASRVEDMGSHFAIRLQRAVLQQWKVQVPWAAAGETTVANGGDIAKEAGLFPGAALQPTTPDEAAARRGSPRPSPFKGPAIGEVPRPTGPRRVVLDAGHGGREIGAAGRLANGLSEKDVNLDIARKAAALLREAGYEVSLTRDADQQVGGPNLLDDLQARVDVANNAHADVFVSIHHNGHSNPGERGIEVYYATDRPFSAESRALADLLYQQIGRHLFAAGYEAYPRGVKADTGPWRRTHYFVLSSQTRLVKRPSLMPAAIGESLFLTNPADAAQLDRAEVRDAIARGYAVAIGAFLTGRRA